MSDRSTHSPFPGSTVEEALEEEVVVVDELQEEEVVVEVEEVLEEVVEAGRSPSMSAALWECDRQRALMGSNPSCGEKDTGSDTTRVSRPSAPPAPRSAHSERSALLVLRRRSPTTPPLTHSHLTAGHTGDTVHSPPTSHRGLKVRLTTYIFLSQLLL
ncbi:hypothetical protein INR49_021996 [Caranx melampygus]|nr:hypothetical protein INR49_021996 [Caranx melampygus]